MIGHRTGRIQSRRIVFDAFRNQAAAFRIGPVRSQTKDNEAPIRHNGAMTMTDNDIIRLIENFKFDAGPVVVERRNRGFTLIHAETCIPIARLRPIGRDDLVEILYWSLWKERWVPFGPLGRTAAPVKQAVRIIAESAIFWAGI
jgi:hypothetical protein